MKKSILMLLALFISTDSYGESFRVIGEDVFPPFTLYQDNGDISGFSVEIMKQLLDETGIQLSEEMELLPWARVLKTIQNEPNILVVNMARTKSREKLFKWVGPISPREIWLFALNSRQDIQIDVLDDAKKFMVGSMRGSASTRHLKDSGFKHHENLSLVSFEQKNLDLLLTDRIDMITFNRAELVWRAGKLNPPLSIKYFKPAFLLSDELSYWIALSKEVPDTVVSKLQNALNNLKQDGRYDKIWMKYME